MEATIQRALQFLSAAESIGHPIRQGARILELGCGAGSLVSAFRQLGWEAHGTDFVFRPGLGREAMLAAEALHSIQQNPYRLPFGDSEFDLIYSTQVFEHVRDFDSTLAESARVQRPDGVGIHVFPSRFRPLEIHTAIPFGGVCQCAVWIWIWSFCASRLPSAQGVSFTRRFARHRAYLAEQVNYVSTAQLAEIARKSFAQVEFNPWAFLQHSPRSHVVRLMRKLPGRNMILGAGFEQMLVLSSPTRRRPCIS